MGTSSEPEEVSTGGPHGVRGWKMVLTFPLPFSPSPPKDLRTASGHRGGGRRGGGENVCESERVQRWERRERGFKRGGIGGRRERGGGGGGAGHHKLENSTVLWMRELSAPHFFLLKGKESGRQIVCRNVMGSSTIRVLFFCVLLFLALCVWWGPSGISLCTHEMCPGNLR